MRTVERLKGIKEWMYHTLCEGRTMKAPGTNLNIGEIVRQEPRVFLAWQPQRPDQSGYMQMDPVAVVPSITIMPTSSRARYIEEKRWDRALGIRRNAEMGQGLSLQILFSVYEPGVRLPGFADSVERNELDVGRIMEGTEQGLFTLLNWIDDAMEAILGLKGVPGTDLFVDPESVYYSLYTDESYIVDKRPVYYGFVNVTFYGHANEDINEEVLKLL